MSETRPIKASSYSGVRVLGVSKLSPTTSVSEEHLIDPGRSMLLQFARKAREESAAAYPVQRGVE